MRLIDADALKRQFIDYVRTPPHFHYGDWQNMCINGTEIDEVIENAPTVDAVEVVRCKDCKHGTWDEEEAMWKCKYDAEFDEQYGEYFGFVEYNDGEHFCSYGERRDNNG